MPSAFPLTNRIQDQHDFVGSLTDSYILQFSSGSGGFVMVPYISNHANLSGLTEDHHPQYLLANGTRKISDDWPISGSGEGRRLAINGAIVPFETLHIAGYAPQRGALRLSPFNNIKADLLVVNNHLGSQKAKIDSDGEVTCSKVIPDNGDSSLVKFYLLDGGEMAVMKFDNGILTQWDHIS